MCLICIELDNNRMTFSEAYRALREYDDSTEEAEKHKREILEDIHRRFAEAQ